MHFDLGLALQDKGRPDEAMAEYREAIRLDANLFEAHYNLGNALHDKDRSHEAIAEYQATIRLKDEYAEAHCNLGHCLCNEGQFAEALKHLQRGHQLGSKKPRWPYPSARWVKECERLVELNVKLSRVLTGDIQPADAGERLKLAKMCQLQGKSLYAAAVRFYADAFAEQPNLDANLQAQHRYNAACAAALAGTAKNAKETTAESDRPPLRRQARDWLQADLDTYTQQVKNGKSALIFQAADRLAHWQTDPDFIGVRDAKSLTKLPNPSKPSGASSGPNVDQLLKQARSLIPETTLKGALTDKQHEQVHEMKLEAGKTYVIDMKSTASTATSSCTTRPASWWRRTTTSLRTISIRTSFTRRKKPASTASSRHRLSSADVERTR